MLVDHLRQGVAQNNDVLVERFDLSLKLDAVDQIDRNGNMFLPQHVEERILQKLNLIAGHDFLFLRRCSFAHAGLALIVVFFRCAVSRVRPSLRV